MVIINGKIFTMEEAPIEGGFVRIKEKLIEEIGKQLFSCLYKKIKRILRTS